VTGEPGAAFYDAAYRSAGERGARWRELGAVGKADHVERLLAERPGRLVEIGCGDGALLAELGRRGVAGSLQGFDVSEEDIRTWFSQLAPDGYERNKKNAQHSIKKLQYLSA